MSPEMLTLVADVLAYDIALETCDLLSSIVEADDVPRGTGRRSFGLSLKEISWTRLEKDIFAVAEGAIDRGREYVRRGRTLYIGEWE
jgi:hypothetical protein